MANLMYDSMGGVKRILEIVKTLSRYNLGEGLTPDRFCEMLKELGPTYVKIGQLLSMHPEIVPPEYCKKLESLRTSAPRDGADKGDHKRGIRQTVEHGVYTHNADTPRLCVHCAGA